MKILMISLAFLCTGIGAVGVVIPVLPTTPFLLIALFLFAKGSEQFYDWFVHTKLYKKHLEGFVKSRGMTRKTKLSILLPVSALLLTTMYFVNCIYARITISILLVVKYWYFLTCIRTLTKEQIEENRNRI